ncbi:hypothetical protein E2C01_023546 [Portunus trituberculatus]|uniref:Uncharacterized protein n=1 Tax=Portunus trituberculatus TaxID=210409 RepID=A0A5B7EBV1_PORTR|nr:hypothetical protein [Portunus trituberculatus]
MLWASSSRTTQRFTQLRSLPRVQRLSCSPERVEGLPHETTSICTATLFIEHETYPSTPELPNLVTQTTYIRNILIFHR